MEELEKMKKDLTKTIIDIYEPESSRWNRNPNGFYYNQF